MNTRPEFIEENRMMKEFTSLYVGGPARYFGIANDIAQIRKALKWANENSVDVFILGGGNNVVVSDEGIDALVLKPDIKGVELIQETDQMCLYRVGAGENWDQFVAMSVDKGLYGVENLSHIPGTVGASLIQNIGAYGQELGESLISCHVYDRETQEETELVKNQLSLGYRTSRFNAVDKGRFIVLSATLKLSKAGELNKKYSDITKYFADHNIADPTLKEMRQAIITVRDTKFPFPDKPEHGTAGSFFKADPVDEKTFDTLVSRLTEKGYAKQAEYIQKMKDSFQVSQGFKVPYGILIESLGFKGKVHGGAKVLESHAGVLINFTGNAKAKDIVELAQIVIDAVYAEYQVRVKTEPELIGNFN